MPIQVASGTDADDYLKRYQQPTTSGFAAYKNAITPTATPTTFAKTAGPVMGESFEPPQDTTTLVRPNATPTPVEESTYTPPPDSTTPPQDTTVMVRPNANPTPEPTPTTTAPPSALDSSISTYLDNTAANLGKPTYITEAGKTYADTVTKSLTSPDASSVNAQATEDTAAARRAYLARMDADERVGQSGFALGGAQATRIADQSQANTNAANQAGQNSVSDYIRQRTELNLNRARGLESDQQGVNQTNLNSVQNQSDRVYGRGEDAADRIERTGRYAVADSQWDKTFEYGKTRDARGDAVVDRNFKADQDQVGVVNSQWNTTNAQNLDQQSWERQQVIKAGTDADKTKLLNSLPEGPAKNAASVMLSQGKTPAEVLAAIFNPDGSIVEAYRGKDTATMGQEALEKEAIVTLQNEAAAKGIMFDPNTAEGRIAVATKVNELRGAKNQPVVDATTARTLEEIKAKLTAGEALTKPETDTLVKAGAIQSYGTVDAVPKDIGSMRPLVGKPIRIGTNDYQVVSAGSVVTSRTATNQARHTDFMTLKTADGKTVYAWGGGIHDAPPKEGEAARIGFFTTE